jgi:hypothetical protein
VLAGIGRRKLRPPHWVHQESELRMTRIPLFMASMLAVAALTFTGGGAIAGAATASRPVWATSNQLTSAIPAVSRHLCRRPGAADRVVITRRTPGDRPRSADVTRALEARSLARAVCALPRLPLGIQCPAIAAGSHRLTFLAGHRKLIVVTVQNVGCNLVTGLRAVRQADKPHFWKLMRRLMRQNRT